jgi:hypothetical protein
VRSAFLTKSVGAAFADDATGEFGKEYLSQILQSWRDLAATERRTAMNIILLAAAFFLLGSPKSGTELTVGPLKVSSSAAILALIPAVVAFLTFELFALFFGSLRYEALRTEVVRKLFPKLVGLELELALAPPTVSLWGTRPLEGIRPGKNGLTATLLDGTRYAMFVVLALRPIGFLIYAYWRLFDQLHLSDVAVWVSVVVSTLSVVRVALLLVDERLHGMWSPAANDSSATGRS